MNLESLEELKTNAKLVKIEYVNIERGVEGHAPHVNVSLAIGGSTRNFNVSTKDMDVLQYLEEWAKEDNVSVTERKVDEITPIYAPFANEESFSRETVIWKYMDFSKFMALLTSSSLWFARLDKNWAVDPTEGRIPQAQWQSLIDRMSLTNFAPVYEGESSVQFGGFPKEGMKRVPEDILKARHLDMQRNLHEAAIYNSYVTCWNVADHESYHMWKLYCGHHNGVAIKSTVGQLIDSLGVDRNYTILGGAVEYLDYENQVPRRTHNLLTHVFCKSLPFLFEKEFRLCLHDHGSCNDVIDKDVPHSFDTESIKQVLKNYKPGYNVGLDLDTLIEEVVVSPEADPWFIDLLATMLENTRVLGEAVSNLADKPVSKSNMC